MSATDVSEHPSTKHLPVRVAEESHELSLHRDAYPALEALPSGKDVKRRNTAPSADPAAPELKAIDRTYTAIDTMLISATVENSRESGSPLAKKDYMDAVTAADGVDTNWLTQQAAAIASTSDQTKRAYSDSANQLFSNIRLLPDPARRNANAVFAQVVQEQAKPGFEGWDKNPDLKRKMYDALPPELRPLFTQMLSHETKYADLTKGMTQLEALVAAPTQTRIEAAKFLGTNGDIQGSREIMNQLLNLDPRLAQDPAFAGLFEDPTKWGSPEFSGGAQQPVEKQVDGVVQQLLKLFELYKGQPQQFEQSPDFIDIKPIERSA